MTNSAIYFNLLWETFCNRNDALKRVIAISVNWLISTDILTRTARYHFQNICWNRSVYGIPMTRFKASFMLQNLPQCIVYAPLIRTKVALALSRIGLFFSVEMVNMQLDPLLFLQTASAIGPCKWRDLFGPIAGSVCIERLSCKCLSSIVADKSL